MSQILDFTVATGRLVLGRDELVALAAEVGADRVRGLDGLGLLHVGVDADAADHRLAQRGLDRSRADLLGSEAAWAHQRLALLRLDRPGDRALLVLRHEPHRLVADLLAAGSGIACSVSAVFDRPVTAGPLTTLAAGQFVIEDLDPPDLPARAWRGAGLTRPDPRPAGDDDGHARPARVARALAVRLREAVRESPERAASRLVDAGLGQADAAALVADMAAGPLPTVRVVGWRRDGDATAPT